MKYVVGISKLYFPRVAWPKRIVQEFFEVVEVQAGSRIEAAQLVWQDRGADWLRAMGLKSTTVRRISLHVANLKTDRGQLGRLEPIHVFTEN